MDDRLTRGFIAGLIGGILMDLWSYPAYYILDFTELKFIDWTGVILFSRLPSSLWELILSILVHLGFTGVLGGVFVFLLKQVSSKNLYFKSILFSMIIFFISYAIPVLFKVPYLYYFAPKTVTSNLIGSVIWAVGMARTLEWLDKREKV